MTANACGIGVSTAKGYVQLFAAAVIQHWKPVYMLGKPSLDRLLLVKHKFEELCNLRDVAVMIDCTHVPWTLDSTLQ